MLWNYLSYSNLSATWARVSKLRTPWVANSRGRLELSGWNVVSGCDWKKSRSPRSQFYLRQRFIFWMKKNWNKTYREKLVRNPSFCSLFQPRLRDRCLKVMGARKNGACEGDTRGERELPLYSLVSLARLALFYFHAPTTQRSLVPPRQTYRFRPLYPQWHSLQAVNTGQEPRAIIMALSLARVAC